ncbi:Cof-type HAD-IIB family hydrolase [Mycoplasma corogypsi]|uniref:Cof-type HAD-IIB family hydrolase n=1 Tax=Mycoplasma corogypsi TaxID=2106 RepID=UPI003872C5DB
MNKRLYVDDLFYQKIIDGTKTVEIRLNRDKYHGILPNSYLMLVNNNKPSEQLIKVLNVSQFKTLEELLQVKGFKNCGFTSINNPNLALINTFYTQEEIQKYGFIAIEFEKVTLKLSDIKNFVFDLDGTLLNSAGNIGEKNLETIYKLKNLGKNIIIATGRPIFTANKVLEKLPNDFPSLLANGSMIYDFKNHKYLNIEAIDKNIIKQIYIKLVEWDYDFVMYSQNCILGYNTQKTDFFTKKGYTKTLSVQQYIEGNAYELLDQLDICKILVVKRSNPEAMWDKVVPLVNSFTQIYGVVSDIGHLDIMKQGVSKASGLEYLVKHFKLDLTKTICFGDGDNDIDMLQKAAYSGCTSNAFTTVKDKALFNLDSNDTNWLSDFILEIEK